MSPQPLQPLSSSILLFVFRAPAYAADPGFAGGIEPVRMDLVALLFAIQSCLFLLHRASSIPLARRVGAAANGLNLAFPLPFALFIVWASDFNTVSSFTTCAIALVVLGVWAPREHGAASGQGLFMQGAMHLMVATSTALAYVAGGRAESPLLWFMDFFWLLVIYFNANPNFIRRTDLWWPRPLPRVDGRRVKDGSKRSGAPVPRS